MSEGAGRLLTPAHQFPLGMTMPLDRRLEVLRWASSNGAFIIEDDYDSEYRFEGRPVPALQSLDQGSSVILTGTFTKLLFPSLRWAMWSFRSRWPTTSQRSGSGLICDPSRYRTGGALRFYDRRPPEPSFTADAGDLCRPPSDFDEEGRKQLGGLSRYRVFRRGFTERDGWRNGMGSRAAETAAASHDVDVVALDRFTIDAPDPRGLLLGFAAFDEITIRKGLAQLAAALTMRPRLRGGRGARASEPLIPRPAGLAIAPPAGYDVHLSGLCSGNVAL